MLFAGGLNPHFQVIGKSAYEKSFNIRFLEEQDVIPSPDYNFFTRVIPTSIPYGFADNFSGRSVAVVGNSVISGRGEEIDAHDEIVRISGMRNWQRSKAGDGVRTTLWSGHLAFVIERETVNSAFNELVDQDVPLWALSPFHVTCDAFLWIKSRPNPPNLRILPSSSILFDLYHDYMSVTDMELLFSIPPARRQLTGLSRYERLLTGTKLVLALEACGVEQISLYGFDLFAGTEDSVWFGHDLDVDRQVLSRVSERFSRRGKTFNWVSE